MITTAMNGTLRFDQTHILTVLGTYKLPRGFQVGARYRYVTGNPTTPIVVLYFNSTGSLRAAQRGAVQHALAALQPAGPARGQGVDLRLLALLDVPRRAERVERLQPGGDRLQLYNFTIGTPISGSPLLPILGLRGDF